jgi:[protein-PII] uridylyltransferase
VRLAEWLKFRDEGGMLGVERFMQEYYRRTTALNDVVQRFLEGSHRPGRLRRIVQRVSTSRVEQHFLLRPPTISIAPDSAATVLDSAERMVLLFDCARDYDVAVEHESAEMVRRAAGHAEVTPAARMRFHRLLANPVGLGRLVRNLNRAGLLGRLLPPFERARCLIQFNLQHRYTVDEHSLRALEAALRRLDDDGPLGGAYRAVGNKALLHLAILLHDLGKGMDGDHCEIGRDIAEGVAREFGLADHERHVLCFLVRQHLLMAHTAFRRDLGDDTTLVQFAREVATPEMLRMLYVLTAADTEAVSPESWTAWKQSLLDQLYARTAEELTGQSPVGNEEERAAAIRSSLAIVLGPHFPADWLVRQLELMPLGYLQSVPAPRIRRDLQVLEQSGSDLVAHVASEWLPEAGFVEYTVFTRDDLTEGIFSKIAGTLSSSGFQIVDARITTRSDDLVIDTFRGQDLTFTGEPPVSHRQEVGRQICDVLLGCKDVEKLLSRRRMPLGTRAAGMIDIPPRVEIDNDTSTRCTIVEVFAEDRLGRLYTITRTLFDLGLSVQSARISTHADQIVDAFYVTTRTGAKITDTGKLETLRARLLEVLARK